MLHLNPLAGDAATLARDSSGRLPIGEYHRLGSARGLNWTPMRKAVLDLLWRSEEPLGAYCIARALGLRGAERNAVSIYRILDTLEQAVLILPVIVRKRFVISPDPEVETWALILCPDCATAAAIACPAEISALRRISKHRGFSPRRFIVECVARCPDCRTEPHGKA